MENLSALYIRRRAYALVRGEVAELVAAEANPDNLVAAGEHAEHQTITIRLNNLRSLETITWVAMTVLATVMAILATKTAVMIMVVKLMIMKQ